MPQHDIISCPAGTPTRLTNPADAPASVSLQITEGGTVTIIASDTAPASGAAGLRYNQGDRVVITPGTDLAGAGSSVLWAVAHYQPAAVFVSHA